MELCEPLAAQDVTVGRRRVLQLVVEQPGLVVKRAGLVVAGISPGWVVVVERAVMEVKYVETSGGVWLPAEH